MRVAIVAMFIIITGAMLAKADYWVTFCKTPGGQQSRGGFATPKKFPNPLAAESAI